MSSATFSKSVANRFMTAKVPGWNSVEGIFCNLLNRMQTIVEADIENHSLTFADGSVLMVDIDSKEQIQITAN